MNIKNNDGIGFFATALVFLVAACILAVSVVLISGYLDKEAEEYGLLGFHVSVPVQYHITYTSEAKAGSSADEHWQQETLSIVPLVDENNVEARPVYIDDWDNMSASWVGQELSALHNQEAISDDYKKLDQDAPDPDEDFVNYAQVIGDEGYTVYTGGSWKFKFYSQDGSILYTKTIRNAVLLRIPYDDAGVDTYKPMTFMNIYIPKWRLPDEGHVNVHCVLDYEVQVYRITHNWEYKTVFDGVLGYDGDIVSDAIGGITDAIGGVWDGVGRWAVRASPVGLAVCAIAVMPISLVVGLGILTAAIVLTAVVYVIDNYGQEQEVPAMESKGYDSPLLFQSSTGTVDFNFELDLRPEPEGTDIASIMVLPAGVIV